jgi:glycosyltransferase involved in cell wall biosynthesis
MPPERVDTGCQVTVITTVHSASDVRIFWKECMTLRRAGFSVELLAPGHGVVTREGVRVVGIGTARSRFDRAFRLTANALRRAMRRRGAILHFHDPELIPALILARLMGRTVVYDAHEDLPLQLLSKPWITSRMRPFLARLSVGLQHVAGIFANLIVAATPPIADKWPAGKTLVVHNYPSVEAWSPILGKWGGMPYRERPSRAVYVGGLTPTRGVLEMARATALVPQRLGCRLALAGNFESPGLESEVRRLSGDRLEFLGWQDHRAIAELLIQARVGLVLLHPTPAYVEGVPTKMFEYMIAGLPVVASDFHPWRETIHSIACGLVVDPLDPNEIASALTWLLDHPNEAEAMGQRGREAVIQRFNWEIDSRRLSHAYEELVHRRRPGSLRGTDE